MTINQSRDQRPLKGSMGVESEVLRCRDLALSLTVDVELPTRLE